MNKELFDLLKITLQKYIYIKHIYDGLALSQNNFELFLLFHYKYSYKTITYYKNISIYYVLFIVNIKNYYFEINNILNNCNNIFN